MNEAWEAFCIVGEILKRILKVIIYLVVLIYLTLWVAELAKYIFPPPPMTVWALHPDQKDLSSSNAIPGITTDWRKSVLT